MGGGIDYSASWTQICNRALGRLGALSISDLSEGTQNAAYCGRFLPEAVEHVLGQYDFKFARRRFRLSPEAAEPLFGWRSSFPLPVSCVRLVNVFDGGSRSGSAIPYQVENGRILADTGALDIVYIERPDNPNFLPQSVRKAVSTHLAYLLSTALTSNEQLIALVSQEAAATLELAKREDAQLGYDPLAEGLPWHTDARGGGAL
jgi:hypothetical protein